MTDWSPDNLHGMTFGTIRNHLVRAGLECINYQIKDIQDAMELDMGSPVRELAVNGGLANNGFLIHFVADLLGILIRKGKTPMYPHQEQPASPDKGPIFHGI